MADAKKVSFNQATAKSTERHNDRSMYKWGYDERAKNVHWDRYDCGSSFDAEARFYDDTFTPTLEAQNDKARAMRKYDRVMDMKTWHKKHPLKECIVQLGDVENNDTSREFAWGAAQVVGDAIKAAGGTVVSIDLHDDESTPHLHVRYAFVGENKDKNPVMDMKNVLLANGIDRPDPSKPISKTNNPAQTFLETTRTALEDYADEVELKHGNPRVNRDRTKRAHSSVQQYKGRKRVEELQRQEKEAIAARDNAFAMRDAALAEVAEKQREVDSAALDAARVAEDNERTAAGLKRVSGAVEKRNRRVLASEETSDARKDVLDEREAEVKTLFNKLGNLIRYLENLKREILDAVDWVKSANDDYERGVRAREAMPKVMKVAEAASKVVVRAPDDDGSYEDDDTLAL
jgi:hypothetical protein